MDGHIGPDALQRFVRILLNGTEADADALFDDLHNSGASVDALFTELLSPAAIELGDMWCDDSASFGDVTLGLATLHKLLRKNSSRLKVEFVTEEHNRSILITPMPEANHIFGIAMIEEYFRSSRWRTVSGFDMREKELLETVRNDHLDVVGISVATTDEIPACGKLVKALRSSSRNADLKIIVGGAAFVAGSDDWVPTGADAFAPNALGAVRKAFELCC